MNCCPASPQHPGFRKISGMQHGSASIRDMDDDRSVA